MDIKLVPLTTDDREQFILDNQQAFKYGAQEEFGMRDDRMEVQLLSLLSGALWKRDN